MFDHRFDTRRIALPETGVRTRPGSIICFSVDCQEITEGHCLKVCAGYSFILSAPGAPDLTLPIHRGLPWHDLPEIRSDPRLWQDFGRLTLDTMTADDGMSFNRAYLTVSLGKWIEGKCLTLVLEEQGLVFKLGDELEAIARIDQLVHYFEFDLALIPA